MLDYLSPGSDLRAVLRAVETASGPQRELDALIRLAFVTTEDDDTHLLHLSQTQSPAAALDWAHGNAWRTGEDAEAIGLPYSASTPAVQALVFGILPGWSVESGPGVAGDAAWCNLWNAAKPDQVTRVLHDSGSEPLAIIVGLFEILLRRGDVKP